MKSFPIFIAMISAFSAGIAYGAQPQPVITSPSNGATLNTTVVDITGTGEPGATIKIHFDQKANDLPTLTADANGNFKRQVAFDNGIHKLWVDQSNNRGIPLSSNVITFTISGAPTSAAVVGTDQKGVSIYSDSCRYTFDYYRDGKLWGHGPELKGAKPEYPKTGTEIECKELCDKYASSQDISFTEKNIQCFYGQKMVSQYSDKIK